VWLVEVSGGREKNFKTVVRVETKVSIEKYRARVAGDRDDKIQE
jgi:hypothetical protein